MEKKRMGSDPLSWIKDTSGEVVRQDKSAEIEKELFQEELKNDLQRLEHKMGLEPRLREMLEQILGDIHGLREQQRDILAKIEKQNEYLEEFWRIFRKMNETVDRVKEISRRIPLLRRFMSETAQAELIPFPARKAKKTSQRTVSDIA
jgi:hypothetical protein